MFWALKGCVWCCIELDVEELSDWLWEGALEEWAVWPGWFMLYDLTDGDLDRARQVGRRRVICSRDLVE